MNLTHLPKEPDDRPRGTLLSTVGQAVVLAEHEFASLPQSEWERRLTHERILEDLKSAKKYLEDGPTLYFEEHPFR